MLIVNQHTGHALHPQRRISGQGITGLREWSTRTDNLCVNMNFILILLRIV